MDTSIRAVEPILTLPVVASIVLLEMLMAAEAVGKGFGIPNKVAGADEEDRSVTLPPLMVESVRLILVAPKSVRSAKSEMAPPDPASARRLAPLLRVIEGA